ncbi:MAG: CvpA family protein [Bacteroidaceae bacterium]|nr:CvpA family protein [Bacteroidaceae bacterium]
MQILDIVILALVAIMTIWGFMRGIVRQIGDLAALLLGIIGANLFGSVVTSWMQTHTDWPLIACQLVAYISLFLIIYLTIRIVVSFIKSLTELVRLGWIDSLAGGLFGAFKTLLLISIVLNVALMMTRDAEIWHSEALTQSMSFEALKDFAPHILNLVWQ